MAKRMMALFMSLLLILTAVPAATAEQTGAYFEIRTVAETCIATEFAVDIMIHGNSAEGISGAVLQLDFDEAVFALAGAEKGSLCDGNDGAFVVWAEDATAISFVSPKATCGDGALIRLTFRTADTVTVGDYPIKVTAVELEDGALGDFTADTGEGSVRVLDYLWGDANGDKKTRTDDVVAILKWKVRALADEDLDLVAADADCDGAVMLLDALLLLQWQAGYVKWAPNGLTSGT